MNRNTIIQIQQALIARGFFPGEVDGVWGRRTIGAVREFQRQAGLMVDGIVGPRTSAALFAPAQGAAETSGTPGAEEPGLREPLLPWMAEAEHLIGTKEVLGPRDNPVILDWARDLDLHYPGDDVPWCGLFVAHCVGATLPDEVLPANPLGARQWERFGDPTEPRLGAVMVFWRASLASGKGHVGFYTGEDAGAYRILGGNQSDSVCITWLAKDRFLRARWPRTGASLGGGGAIIMADRRADLSTNEA